jgi:transcriptional regulator with XRE-family HTH domain
MAMRTNGSTRERARCRRPIIGDEVAYLERLGDQLRELRHQAGLTQATLAKRAGVHVNTVARIEHGLRRTRRGTLERLVRALSPPRRLRSLESAFYRAWMVTHPEELFPALVESLVDIAGPALAPPRWRTRRPSM